MSESAAPSISVLIPAYNAARYFPAAIESVLAQTHKEFELILIDDGSTDDTLAIAQRYARQDPRIKVITHQNMGMGASLNDAMQQAAGNWIVRLDADDVMLPNRLDRQLRFLAENPDLKVASSTVTYIDDAGRPIGQFTSAFITREEVQRANRNDEPVGFHHPAAIFHKATIQHVGGYRPQFWPADDLDLWNRVIDAGHGVLVQDERLTQYRIHGSSVMVSKMRVAEQKVQWVTACIKARHHNQPEPTEAQFQAERRNRPFITRLNESRRELARGIYKSAVFHYSRRRYARFVPTLAAAAALEPTYVLRRILPQFRRAEAPSPGTPGEGRGEGDFERQKPFEIQNHPHPKPLPDYREKGPELQVLMPAHNAAPFLAAAIESVQAQTHANFTLHIVDDGSTDNTLAIARDYAAHDPRIQITTHANIGIANTLNQALHKLRHHEWVINMHGDDLMAPARLERQLAFLNQNPDLAVASTLVQLIDDTGRPLGPAQSAYTSREAVQTALAAGRSITFNHPATAVRPNVILAAGGYRQDFWPAEDTELWNRLAAQGHHLLVQDEYLLQYRVHAKAASTARARLMIQKLAWTTACIEARRDKKLEPTWTEFQARLNNAPLFTRLNNRRKESARTLYQLAVHHLAAKRYAALTTTLTLAALLEPTLIAARILPRLFPRRAHAR